MRIVDVLFTIVKKLWKLDKTKPQNCLVHENGVVSSETRTTTL